MLNGIDGMLLIKSAWLFINDDGPVLVLVLVVEGSKHKYYSSSS